MYRLYVADGGTVDHGAGLREASVRQVIADRLIYLRVLIIRSVRTQSFFCHFVRENDWYATLFTHVAKGLLCLYSQCFSGYDYRKNSVRDSCICLVHSGSDPQPLFLD